MCEDVCNQARIFKDDENVVVGVKSGEELKDAAKDKELVAKLEERLQNWTKKVMEASLFWHFLRISFKYF